MSMKTQPDESNYEAIGHMLLHVLEWMAAGEPVYQAPSKAETAQSPAPTPAPTPGACGVLRDLPQIGKGTQFRRGGKQIRGVRKQQKAVAA